MRWRDQSVYILTQIEIELLVVTNHFHRSLSFECTNCRPSWYSITPHSSRTSILRRSKVNARKASEQCRYACSYSVDPWNDISIGITFRLALSSLRVVTRPTLRRQNDPGFVRTLVAQRHDTAAVMKGKRSTFERCCDAAPPLC